MYINVAGVPRLQVPAPQEDEGRGGRLPRPRQPRPPLPARPRPRPRPPQATKDAARLPQAQVLSRFSISWILDLECVPRFGLSRPAGVRGENNNMTGTSTILHQKTVMTTGVQVSAPLPPCSVFHYVIDLSYTAHDVLSYYRSQFYCLIIIILTVLGLGLSTKVWF